MVVIQSVAEGSRAARAGLLAGDTLIAINGNEVSAYEDVTSIVKASSVGDILTFQIYRDGKLTEAKVEVFEKIPEEESEPVEFETERKDSGADAYPESEDVYVSPVPRDEYSDGYGSFNPFEGTPFEDFFSGGWGF